MNLVLFTHLKGETSIPLSENSISKSFFKNSMKNKDELALISDFQEIQLTYESLFKISERAAGNMIDLGLKPGTKVGLYSPNSAEWLICQYACALADLQMVNINPAYKPKELMHGLALAEVETLIVSDNIVPARIFDNVEYFMQDQKVVLSQFTGGDKPF